MHIYFFFLSQRNCKNLEKVFVYEYREGIITSIRKIYHFRNISKFSTFSRLYLSLYHHSLELKKGLSFSMRKIKNFCKVIEDFHEKQPLPEKFTNCLFTLALGTFGTSNCKKYIIITYKLYI